MSLAAIRIVKKSFFTDDILRLRLATDLPIEFKAGQYILLGLDSEELKPFSLAIAPDGSGELECHIRKNPASPWMQKLFSKKQGETLYWQGPIDHVSLKAQAMPTIFVAGGTGFSLVKSLLEALLKTQPTFPIHVYWGVRQAADLYQHDWMQQLAQQHQNIAYTTVVSEPDADWQGDTRAVHEKVVDDYPDLTAHRVYLCGPPMMLPLAKQLFITAGLDEQHFIA